MFRTIIIILALLICILSETQAESVKSVDKNDLLKIVVTSFEKTDKTLKLLYEIRNDSEDDVWLLSGWDINCTTKSDVFMSEDDQTLVLRRRMDLISFIFGPPFYGIFVRMCPGECRTEVFLARIPVHPFNFFRRTERTNNGLEYANRLCIELNYYTGNIPERIYTSLKPQDNVLPKSTVDIPVSPNTFSGWNERSISRDEELLFGYPYDDFERAQILKVVFEDIHIPYNEEVSYPTEPIPPDLTSCTKIEFQYYPSMLEYFFPYESQQNLMSQEEISYLQSENTICIEDIEKIAVLANDINNSYQINGFVCSQNHVDIKCYYENMPSSIFSMYNNEMLAVEGKPLLSKSQNRFTSLKKITPLIPSIELRMRCASNLKNQWYRFRFHNMLEAIRQNDLSIRNKKVYPIPNKWCDAVLMEYPGLGGIVTGKLNPKPHICPSAGEGNNHYAMNPNCRPDSPSDVVLLFETKAGWNQHGGPELFTFDNHDPKGGCVLLNDGTVKFIRTKKELRQLRWK